MFPIRDNIPSRSIPFVNYILILINAAVFWFELGLGDKLEPFIYHFGLVPSRFHPSQLLSSMFLHGGWMHVISNLWTLYIFGDNVEDRVGHLRYLGLYILCGITAGAVQMGTHLNSSVPTIGASGAIAGIMGAYFILYPRARVLTLIPIFVFVRMVELPAFLYLGFWFAVQVYTGALAVGGAGFSGVAWWAHIGGFASGFLFLRLFLPRQRSMFSDW